MQYLVSMEASGNYTLTKAKEVSHFLEHTVIPSLESCVSLQLQSKIIAGGMISGSRSSIFILESSSHEDVSRLLMNLPIWGSTNVTITPIEDFASRLALHQETVDRIKGAD